VTRWSSFEAKVLAAFGAASLVVVSLASATWYVADNASHAAHQVAQSQELLQRLASTRGYTLQIELATQNFRISGDPAQLAERDQAIADRETALARIRDLVRDDQGQQQSWSALRTIINQRLAISRQVEILRKTQGQSTADAFVATAPLRATRVRTYQLLSDMDANARASLAHVEAVRDWAQHRWVLSGLMAATSLSLLLAGAYVLIRRQGRRADAAQQALCESEENLSTTLHSIGDAVLATDTEGRVSRMNPVAELLTGWSFSEARGRPIAEVFRIIHEKTRQPAVIPVETVLATGGGQGLAEHTTIISRSGVEVPIADSAAPIHDRDGALRGVVLVFRDVTMERQAAQMLSEHNALLARDVRARTAALQGSESHLRSVISAVPALIAFVDSDRRYVYVNEQYRERFAPGYGEIAGRTVLEILGEERYAIAKPMIDKVLTGEPQGYDWQPFTGVWQAIRYLPKTRPDGSVAGYYVLGTDITERKRSEERIQTLNAELAGRVGELEHVSRALRTLSAGNRALLRASTEQELLDSMCRAIVAVGGYGTAIVWFRQDDDGKPDLLPMAECGNPGGMASLRTAGLTLHDDAHGQSVTPRAILTGRVSLVRDMQSDPNHAPWRDRLIGPTSSLACPLSVAGRVIGALTIYDTATHAFGDDEIALLTESAGDLAFGIAALRDRAEQERVRTAIDHMLRHDVLTGLPNAIGFAEAVTTAVEARPALRVPMAVLQLNIERLGEINEVLGPLHGDQILKDFGQRLQDTVPAATQVARLRGDEFAILAPARDAASAIAIAQAIEDSLSVPFSIADLELDVSAKTGIALFPEHGRTTQDLLRRMGRALYQARARGISHRLFDPSEQQDQTERLQLASELRRAIQDGQLRVFLQPKIEIASGRVLGAEALMRWQHPRKGLLAPGLFIGLAEQTGLIKPLTEWLIVAVLDLLREWQAQGCALPIAINISARNFGDKELLDKFLDWRAERGVAEGLLEIEITESTLMEDAEHALKVLHALRAAGVPLYVDDFGTGYSSLSYLQKLPVDYIKIDQSFVAAMTRDRDSATIVRSTIDLVHDLGHKTVAEGVETLDHWNLLADLGCDIAQDYFIAKPMPADALHAWVAGFCNSPPGSLIGAAVVGQ